MPTDRYGIANSPATSLAVALGVSDTTAIVTDPSILPTDGVFPVRLENATDGTFELALGTAVVANQVTLTRANENGGRFPAQAFAAGSVFRPVVTEALLDHLIAFYRGGNVVQTARDVAVEGAGLTLEADETNGRAVLRASAAGGLDAEAAAVVPGRVRVAAALYHAANHNF